jgi:hypothetical protein
LLRCYHLGVISGIESTKLKLLRAKEHIKAIQRISADYGGREPSTITREPDGTEKLGFVEQPPRDIALLAGEVIYQIRSALDHLTFDLVKLNSCNITLPKGWEKRCEFPLLVDIPTKGNPPVPFDLPLPHSCFQKNLPGISIAAYTFIESLQPYYRRNGASQLRLLAQLSNIDKHRHLHIVNPQAYVREIAVSYEGFDLLSVRRTQNGAEIQPAYTPEMLTGAVQVQRGFLPFVSFDESALGKGAATLPVDHILELCLDVADRTIVPAFEKFIQNS